MKRIILIVLILSSLIGCKSKSEAEILEPIIPEVIDNPITVEQRSPFSGEITDQDEFRAFSVIVENSAAARPHSGLSSADIIYEIAVDGWNITRFLAIYSKEYPYSVGPVRSGRVPLVSIAVNWNVSFVHYGAAENGQGDAYTTIRNHSWPKRYDGVSGLNDRYFYRDQTRSSPHNAYFNANNAMESMPLVQVKPKFNYSDEPSSSIYKEKNISFTYSSSLVSSYKYSDDNLYYRYINGQPMIDRNNQQHITTTNIIVLQAEHYEAEPVRYVLTKFEKGGKLWLFTQGQVIEGYWTYNQGDFDLYETDGTSLLLSVGKTWVQVINQNMKISIGD